MASAYFVPTPEASVTAVAGRALQGLGCASCQGGMGWYVRGVQSPALLSGLGAGAGSGRFNRAVARGIYSLPFVQDSAPGSYGLGNGSAAYNPGTGADLLLIGGFAVAAWFFLRGGSRRRRRRYAG